MAAFASSIIARSSGTLFTLGEAWIDVDDRGIDRAARGQPGEDAKETRHAGAQAVFRPAPVREVRHRGLSVRRRQYPARHGLVERPYLDVHHDMHDEALAAGTFERNPLVGELVGDPGLLHIYKPHSIVNARTSAIRSRDISPS
jgi:hypothetical protein